MKMNSHFRLDAGKIIAIWRYELSPRYVTNLTLTNASFCLIITQPPQWDQIMGCMQIRSETEATKIFPGNHFIAISLLLLCHGAHSLARCLEKRHSHKVSSE